MVSIERVKSGIAGYLDNELLPKLPAGWRKWAFSAVAIGYLNELPNIVEKLKTNEYVAMLNVIDDNNEIDIDKVYQAVRPAAEKCSAPISLPGMGTITLNVIDIDNIYNWIIH